MSDEKLMKDALNLQLISMTGEKFNERVCDVSLPTTTGQISVFPSHEDLITLATDGVITVRRNRSDPDSALEFFATSGGIIEIINGGKSETTVRILVDEANHGADIIEEKTRSALAKAMELREKAAAGDDMENLATANRLISRNQVKLKVAGLQRRAKNLRH